MKTSAFHRRLLLGAALLVGMPLSAAAKCRNFLQPLFVIDGRQATEAEFAELRALHPESIAAIEIRCWNPADSTLNLDGTGMPVTYVVTKGLIESITADLQRVADAQQRFFAKHSTFSAKLSELGTPGATADGVSIELTAAPTGWSATASKPVMVHRCAVVVGEVAPPATQRSLALVPTELVTDLVQGVPACFLSIDPRAKHALESEG
jgi:hypothetical protein